MTYSEWCADQERRYDTMPTWYWNSAERLRRYHAEADRKLDKPSDDDIGEGRQ